MAEDRKKRSKFRISKLGTRPKGGSPKDNFEFRNCRNAGGFTLMETLFIIVMVSVFMAAIMLPLVNSLKESDTPEIATIAYFLGLEKLEEQAAQTTGSISDEAKAAVSGFGDYEREVAITDVDCDDLTTSDPDSGCRKVTVTVYHAKIPNGVSLVTFRTSYAQEAEEPPTPEDFNMCAATSSTDSTGNIYDSGGPSGNYGDNEDCTFLISPTGSPSSITLSFSSFDVEAGYDYLYVYDGTDTSGVLLGQLDGTSIPSDRTATSGSMFLRFTSDGGVIGAGFAATWTSVP